MLNSNSCTAAKELEKLKADKDDDVFYDLMSVPQHNKFCPYIQEVMKK